MIFVGLWDNRPSNPAQIQVSRYGCKSSLLVPFGCFLSSPAVRCIWAPAPGPKYVRNYCHFWCEHVVPTCILFEIWCQNGWNRLVRHPPFWEVKCKNVNTRNETKQKETKGNGFEDAVKRNETKRPKCKTSPVSFRFFFSKGSLLISFDWPESANMKNIFFLSYGYILSTSLTYFVPLTRGC